MKNKHTISTSEEVNISYYKQTEDEQDLQLSTRFLRDLDRKPDHQTLEMAQALIRAGFKVTKPRLAILAEIIAFNRQFEINELVKKLEDRPDFKPGVASVFRTVKLLTDLGVLQRLHTDDGCHRYGLMHVHSHRIVCRCCERAVEFAGCDFTELVSFLERKSGFKLEGHWIEFYGLCAECRANAIDAKGTTSRLLPHHHAAESLQLEDTPINVREVSQMPAPDQVG